MKKSLFLLVMLCACLLFMVACGADEPATTDEPATGEAGEAAVDEGEVYEIKMSLQDAEANPNTIICLDAIAEIEERSEGRIEIDHYAAGVLGDYITIYEDLQKGAVDMAEMSFADTFNDLFNVMMMPYAVSSFAQAEALYDPAGGYLFELTAQGCEETDTVLIAPINVGFMGVGGNDGFGNFDTVLDPFTKQEGGVIRVPMMESYVILLEAMGFSVTTIAYGDTYTSLQTGVCDGLTGTSAVTAWTAFRDVLDTWVDYKHILELHWVAASEACVERLPEDLWAMINEVFTEAYFRSSEEREQQDLDAVDLMIEAEWQTLVPTEEELQPMVSHVQEVVWPYYATYFEARGGQEFVDGIIDAINAAE